MSNPGASFKGAGLYYLHDKDTLASSERVEWTHVLNIPTDDPKKALAWMAYTAIAANEYKDSIGMCGRPIEKPVWTASLSWHTDQQPTQEEMIRAHSVEGFDCGKDALNRFLTRFAFQNQQANASQTYVALNGDDIVGFYTLVFGQVEYADAPERLTKGLARHPVPQA